MSMCVSLIGFTMTNPGPAKACELERGHEGPHHDPHYGDFQVPCPVCGEDDAACARTRAEVRGEPWLPNGFELGAQWYSYDGGLSWERFPQCRPDDKRSGSMTVTGIDRERGIITVKVDSE